MSRLGVITGMAIEAAHMAAAARRLPEDARPLIAAAGGDSRSAERFARRFAGSGAVGLVSFGVAGGLDPSLAPGDILIADAVCFPAGAVTPTHASWREAVAADIGPWRRTETGRLAGSESAVTTAAAKAALRARCGAAAVDQESCGVAAAAAAAGLPFIVVRAIADPASRAVPSAALAGLGPDGRRRPFAVLVRLLAHPSEGPALWRVARDSGRALDSLAAAAPAVLRARPD